MGRIVAFVSLFALTVTACAPARMVMPKSGDGGRNAGDHYLKLCHGAPARHTSTIGEGGEIMLFTREIPTRAGKLLRNPTDGGCLTSGFGRRPHLNGGRSHKGLDLARPTTRRIFAAGDGKVVYSGWARGYGLVVRIDHGKGIETVYAHLDPSVDPAKKGARVRRGKVIGRMGTTGNSTGVHLHYELRVDGAKVDPLRYGLPQVLAAFR